MPRGLFIFVTCLAAGCSPNPDLSQFTPPSDAAEQAVRLALEDWKAGHAAGPIAGTHPAVHAVDAGRKPGQTLAAFQILGEAQSGSSGRTFVVELELKNPDLRERAKYVVVGIDPLWVFRQEDYDLLSHWDHHMPAAAGSSAETSASAAERVP